jgi:MFS family permease
MAQAGISLHQVAHYINLGLPTTSAALTASTFAFAQIPASLFWAALGRRVPVRFLLAGSAFILSASAIASVISNTIPTSLLASFSVGFGVGGIHLLIRLAWADYYGREHLGSIRGLTMAAQVGGQAIGPVLSGFMFDYSGNYSLPFIIYAASVLVAGLGVLFATPPKVKNELDTG